MKLGNMLPRPISSGEISIEMAINIDPQVLRISRDTTDFSCNVSPRSVLGCYNFARSVAALICVSQT